MSKCGYGIFSIKQDIFNEIFYLYWKKHIILLSSLRTTVVENDTETFISLFMDKMEAVDGAVGFHCIARSMRFFSRNFITSKMRLEDFFGSLPPLSFVTFAATSACALPVPALLFGMKSHCSL